MLTWGVAPGWYDGAPLALNCNGTGRPTLNVQSYLKDKIGINRILYEHYGQNVYRKLKMNIYINTQRSEGNMIAAFREKFGLPKDVLIIFGDYGQLETMKGCEPHISKRLRKIFKDNGYELYKIDEYNTSKLCNKCAHENERFQYVKGKDGKDHLLWGLLRCSISILCECIK